MGDFRDLTRFLFADPSFTAGVGAAVDMGGTLVEFNRSISPEQADARAIASDWAAVGLELRIAIDAHEATPPQEKEAKSANGPAGRK